MLVHGYVWEFKAYDRIAGEVWKAITKHEELKGYDISSKGRLRNTNRVGNPLIIPFMRNTGIIRFRALDNLYSAKILVLEEFYP